MGSTWHLPLGGQLQAPNPALCERFLRLDSRGGFGGQGVALGSAVWDGLVGICRRTLIAFLSLPIKIDYVSNFLSGFPRSLSLRTVLKHKHTKRVSARREFKELTFGGREGDPRGRQTQRGPPFSASMFWIKKKIKQKPSNLRLAVSRGKKSKYACVNAEIQEWCLML